MRFPKDKPTTTIIRERYGQEGLSVFKKFEKLDFKLRKLSCDLEFLDCCVVNGLSPNFLHFRLYSSVLENDEDYQAFQKQLLLKEVQIKRDLYRETECEVNECFSDLSRVCSYIDLKHLKCFINKINDKKIIQVKETHNRKLFNLGLTQRYEKIDPDKVIYNFSDYVLTSEQKNALYLGLKFNFNPSNICYARYFSGFKQLLYKLNGFSIRLLDSDSPQCFKSNLKTIAFKFCHAFKPKISKYHKQIISCLRDLSKNEDLIVSKPDKGNGIVLIRKEDYLSKMNDILLDPTNFSKVKQDLYPTLLKHQDKNNRLADLLNKTWGYQEIICSLMKTA